MYVREFIMNFNYPFFFRVIYCRDIAFEQFLFSCSGYPAIKVGNFHAFIKKIKRSHLFFFHFALKQSVYIML